MGWTAEPVISTKFTYKTPYQQIGTVEDPRGNVTEYFYDANHDLERIVRPTVPEGTPEEILTINAFGLVESRTDENGIHATNGGTIDLKDAEDIDGLNITANGGTVKIDFGKRNP